MAFPLAQLLQGAAEARSAFVSGRRDAQQSAQQQQLQQGLQMLALKRQQQQDDLAAALHAAQMRHLGAQTDALGRPPAAPRDYVKEHEANRLFDLAHPTPIAPTQEPIVPVVQGGKTIYQPRSKAIGQEAPRTEPQQSFTPVTLGGGEGQPSVIKPFNTRTGAVGEAIGEAKPAVTRIENAQQELTRARAQASVSEMNNADTMMQNYEQKLRSGQVDLGPVSQYLGALGSVFTHDDPISVAAQNAALAGINRVNPDFARYVRRALSFAEGESGISARPSDFRTRMAAFLSRVSSGASPELIDDVSSRRSVILKTLNRIYPDAAAEGRGQPTTPTTPSGGRGAGAGGNINLGKPSEAEWAKTHPPKAGETFDQYEARYRASVTP